MRVTTLQTSNIMMDYVTSAQSKYYELAEEASSGKKVTEPSDDPVATKSIITTNTKLSELNDYLKNMKTAQSELNNLDSTLNSVTNSIQNASDYATQAANGTYKSSDLATIKLQIDSIMESVVNSANTQFDGKYIFSGTATSAETYTITHDASGNITGATYNGTATNEYQRYVTISDGVSVPVNARGNSVFGSYTSTSATNTTPYAAGDTAGINTTTAIDGNGNTVTTTVITTINSSMTSTTRQTITETGQGLLYSLGTLSTGLANNNQTVISSCINSLDTDLNTVTATRTKMAAVSNKFDITTSSINQTITNLKSFKSNLEDADLAQVLTELTTAKSAMEATYSVTSQLLASKSLLDYL